MDRWYDPGSIAPTSEFVVAFWSNRTPNREEFAARKITWTTTYIHPILRLPATVQLSSQK